MYIYIYKYKLQLVGAPFLALESCEFRQKRRRETGLAVKYRSDIGPTLPQDRTYDTPKMRPNMSQTERQHRLRIG